MYNQLADPAFWERVEGGEILDEIASLEAIPVDSRSKKDTRRLATLRVQLDRIKPEAARLAALNNRWQSGDEDRKRDPKVTLTDDWAKDLFLPDTKEAGKLYCSFCDAETSEVHGTRGKGKPQISKIEEIIELPDGGMDVREKIIVKVSDVIACPACSLKVRNPQVVITS
jgi:hypothetical protein